MNGDLPQYERIHDTRSGAMQSTGRTIRPRTEHLYHLMTSKNLPWLTLKVISKAPAPHNLPSFYEGETIVGTVVLQLEKEEPVKAVSIQIFGQMTSSAMDVLTFVQTSQILWSQSDSPSSSTHPGKLRGAYSWPYSISLPEYCVLKSSNRVNQQYPLPASFSERMARVHIQYQIVVTVHRSRFRVDSTLGTVIGYCPLIRPEAPSLARQIAYLESSPLIGPDGDPDGWKCLAPLRVDGSVFSTRTVEATCTLALAKPLCYTRGSVIPCLLTIETTDPQALDLLSAPRTPVVRLLRRISTQDATAGSAGAKTLARLDYEVTVQEVTAAVWWTDSHSRDPRCPQRRVLHGEIHLSAGLKPSCRLGKFELSYSVAVYPPRAVAFAPYGSAEAVLQQEPVVIGTVYAAGPRPRVHSPPGYDDASSSGQASEFRLFR
ncbi:hypothetical protein C8Q77DRAFT_768334 [Trametes polyzona]|nr:hypothetical protein C8Q77DRAFT_768334 [Trametes polyzona]